MRISVIVMLLCLGTSLTAQHSVKTYKSLQRALEMPDSVFVLDLSGKNLKQFPKEILEFKNLEVLKLKKCRLKSIEDVSSLTKLKVLDLNSNKLDSIHPSIYSLHALEKLRLGHNRISTVDKKLGQLVNLKLLDLWGNLIDDLPESISELKKLTYLDLRVMEISSLRQEYISKLLPECRIFFTVPCNCMQEAIDEELED